MNKHKRKVAVHLVERGDVLNTRIIANIIANKIRKGEGEWKN